VARSAFGRKGHIQAKAMRDPAFRRSLLKNPRKALEAAGIKVPSGTRVKVHQNTGSTVHIVLPSKPARARAGARRPKRPPRMGPQFTIPL